MLFAMFLLAGALNCEIPLLIWIEGAQDPCWTLERLRSQYMEAEVDVEFSRWLSDRPFSKENFDDVFLRVVEHPDIFEINGVKALGVFMVGGLHVIGPDTIEYSLKHEHDGPIQILRHELGHRRELKEESKWTPNAIFNTYGWWHFGHGDFLDSLVQTTQWVLNWFFRGLPENHSYWPGKVGHLPAKGTPGALPPIFPPLGAQNIELFSDFDYHKKQHEEHNVAVCILRPQ